MKLSYLKSLFLFIVTFSIPVQCFASSKCVKSSKADFSSSFKLLEFHQRSLKNIIQKYRDSISEINNKMNLALTDLKAVWNEDANLKKLKNKQISLIELKALIKTSKKEVKELVESSLKEHQELISKLPSSQKIDIKQIEKIFDQELQMLQKKSADKYFDHFAKDTDKLYELFTFFIENQHVYRADREGAFEFTVPSKCREAQRLYKKFCTSFNQLLTQYDDQENKLPTYLSKSLNEYVAALNIDFSDDE